VRPSITKAPSGGTELEAVVRRVLRDELLLCSSSNPDELVDTEVAAVLVGVTPAALRRAHERGQFPVAPVRVGRRLRWRRGDLLALAERDDARASK